MRWQWLRRQTKPDEPLGAPPGPIPDGDTIPVQRPDGGHYPLYSGMVHVVPADPTAGRRLAGNRGRRWRSAP